MEDVEELITKKVKIATDKLKSDFDGLTAGMVGQISELNEQVEGLKEKIREMERNAERNEQYNRKSSLILSGDSVPPPPSDHFETAAETRAIASEIIKTNLGVTMQGPIVACHRLRNKKRVLVKFQDSEDREAVYQARFDQGQDQKKTIIHENLTETRAAMVSMLGKMREGGHVTNYHTKNGMIYARNSRDKKYALIEPWLSEEGIMKAMRDSPNKTTNSTNMSSRPQGTGDNRPTVRSQARQAVGLDEFVVTNKRQTRQQTKVGE